MKKLTFLTALVLLISFSSCRDESDGGPETLIEEIDLSAEAAMDANFEEVDVIVEASMQTINEAGRTGSDETLSCATVTRDIEAKTLTIDFGEGCVGPRGRVRSGKIVITYSSPRFEPGSTRSTTFENFYIDDVRVEGTRTFENISESIQSVPVFQISLTGGKLTFPDSTSATRDATRTRVWVRAANPIEDQAKVVESASGTKRNGESYSMATIDTLVFKRGCKAVGVFIPVSGIKELSSGSNQALLDFGDGTCDNEVSVSINGGEPVVRTIKPRGVKR